MNALLLTDLLQWAVRQMAKVESEMTSVERVFDYSCLQSEADLETHPKVKPPLEWPYQGNCALHINI